MLECMCVCAEFHTGLLVLEGGGGGTPKFGVDVEMVYST